MERNAGSLKPIRATLVRAGRLYLIFTAPGAAYLVGRPRASFATSALSRLAAGEAVSAPL